MDNYLRHRRREPIEYQPPLSSWSMVEWITNLLVLVFLLWALVAAFMNYGGSQ